MSFIGYLRVSTNNQNTENQKLAILKYANANKFNIDQWIEVKASSQKSNSIRKLDELQRNLKSKDTVIVTELSRLGRSVGQIIILMDELLARDISFISIKENLKLSGKKSIQTKVMTTMLGLFAELERDLISQRTKEGLARARKEGKILGRPKGSYGKSKLDGKEEEIKSYLSKGVTKASIAKIYEVSWPALNNFIKTRNIPDQRSIKLKLNLMVENNSKFVRGKKKARERIELFHLEQYKMQKEDKDGWIYDIEILFKNEKDLEDKIQELYSEMENEADLVNCFIEADIYNEKTGKSW